MKEFEDRLMTEFEKWYRRNIKLTEDDYICWDAFSSMEYGWKAALEWVKRELYTARDASYPDLGLWTMLEDELGEEADNGKKARTEN